MRARMSAAKPAHKLNLIVISAVRVQMCWRVVGKRSDG